MFHSPADDNQMKKIFRQNVTTALELCLSVSKIYGKTSEAWTLLICAVTGTEPTPTVSGKMKPSQHYIPLMANTDNGVSR
jgi:hypothetical protein